MSRINQPPAPVLPNAGRTIDAGMKTTAAPQQAAAQPQGRAAAAQDGFTAQAAAPMVLNPPQAQATRREVLPSATPDPKTPPSQQQLREMVLKAFHDQYGRNATATEAFIQQWMDQGMKIFNKDKTAEFLGEKLFTAMNKAAGAGQTSPLADTNPKRPPSDQQLRDMVTKAFHEQYGKNATATEDFIKQWMNEAKSIYEKAGTTEFLFEKVFSAMNKAAGAGQTSPLPNQDFTKLPSDTQLRDMVMNAFKQQYGRNATATEDFIQQWMNEAKKIFTNDKTSQYLGEKLFTAMNKAAGAGQTSPLPNQDFSKLPSDTQLRDMVTNAFKQQYGRNATATEAFINQWMDEAKKIFANDKTSQFLGEKLFTAMNKAAASGQTSPLPNQDFTKLPSDTQLRDMVMNAFHQQYGRNATATDAFINQWMDEAKKIFANDKTSQFLGEKVFSAMNKAAASGQTSPLPQQDFKQRPTDDQLKAAVEFAFKQKFNDKPTDNEMKAWMAEALKIFERDKTSQFLGEKLFTALQNASTKG
jgi:hypothetical protein